MVLKVEGVWCKTRTEFDKLSKAKDYDMSVSYFDIFNRLIKSDPYSSEPSSIIVALYIRKMLQKLFEDLEEKEEINIAYMFKDLDAKTVSGFKDFMNDLASDRLVNFDLIIVNRCDYPKKGVLSKFDNVKFIDND